MELITGFKKNTFLYKDSHNYLYRINRKTKGKIYLRCKTCNVRAVLELDGSVGVRGTHMHDADLEEIAELLFREDLRHAAMIAPETNAKDIFNEVKLGHQTAAQAVSFDETRAFLYAAKSEGMPLPHVPRTQDEVSDSPECDG